MNYEELYEDIQPICKSIKDQSNLIGRMYKSIIKGVETGDLKGAAKALDTIRDAIEELSIVTDNAREKVEGFDKETYFSNGEFTEQMLEICQQKEIDVIGESPVFEIFPYRVRIDAENQEVYLNRKKITTMRPNALVSQIAASREKLMKASFNAQRFADELAEAYDLAILKYNKRPQADLYLTNIYKLMVPLSRFRKDYDANNFAFDIARLYDSEVEATKNGRRWQFGSSRNQNKAIRILDADGNEQFFATIKFFDPEG